MAQFDERLSPEDQEFLKAKSDALRLLSFSARSIKELREKLKAKRYLEQAIDRAVGVLEKQGLMDDSKFAKLYAESRVYHRPTGKRQLEMDLKKKGVSTFVIRETVDNLKDYDEKGMVRELAKKRLKSMTGIPKEKKKTRLYGFLKRRGFGNDAIFPVMDELLKASAIEDLEMKENSSED